jgi:NADH:ubiquinone oxidoreductase subunit 6 (subunit J)
MTIGDAVPLTSIRWDDVLFVVLAATLLGSALLVVTQRDIIRCGLALAASFAALAGIYGMLGNPLVAVTQVLVYIGAVAVLVLFAIMLTQTKNAPLRLAFQTQAWAAALAAIAIAAAIAGAVSQTSWPAAGEVIQIDTPTLARSLFHDYVLPFEAVSVLLTASVVGGVYLARRERGDERGEPGRDDEERRP